jgi:PQQ-dependent dehydrogenase (methanol/ethanol family)
LIKKAAWLIALTASTLSLHAQPPSDQSTGEQLFGKMCAGCHGAGAAGGDRGPALVNSRSIRNRSESQIQDLIRNGTTGGMPGFPLPESQLKSLAQWVRSLNVSAHDLKPEGNNAAGEQFFFGKGQCSSCHMVRGRGKSNGPDLSDVGTQLNLRDLQLALDNPDARVGSRSAAACPGWAWCPQDPWSMATVRLRDGSSLRGYVRSQGQHDLQLQTSDGRLHLLNDAEYREVSRDRKSAMPPLRASSEERRDLLAYLSDLSGSVEGPLSREWDPLPANAFEQIARPKKGDWPAYNGDIRGNRHVALDQINDGNVNRLRLQWSYTLPNDLLQTTPLVADGVMYVSAPNRVAALDARSGREIWSYAFRRPDAVSAAAGPAIGGGGAVNRGVAILADRVFFTSADAQLICLNRLTGALMWVVRTAEPKSRATGPSAPLIVGDLVLTGIAGGDGGTHGFVAAYKASTGQEVWRFRPIPNTGEPGADTWRGTVKGGGGTWLTGSYDPDAGVVYWTTGQPYPPTDGSPREGDNLYTNCVVALDPKTGKLLWHYQFTPHDLHDWDANEPLLLVDARYRGRDRKLVLQANRNGFFYALDRTNGELLLAKPFVKKLTWASGVGNDGRPILLDGNRPTQVGTKTCPAVRGATNWYSTAFSPAARLFYVMAVEDCNIYRQSRGLYVPYRDPSDPPEKYLRALDIETGKIVWEIPQVGPPEFNYSGVLSTAGNLLFYGETGGSFAALNAKTGKNLWHVGTGQQWKASPMTYMVNGRQYVAIAAGSNILSFALPE